MLGGVGAGEGDLPGYPITPGMGVSVGVEVPGRRFTFMSESIHEDNYESKARASP
jgi:hypothetical protein